MATPPPPAPSEAPQPSQAGAAASAAAASAAAAPVEPHLAEQYEHHPVPQLTFWQQPWVQNLLPFATSLALHLAIVVIGILSFKAIEQVTTAIREQIIIPDATIVENAPVGGIPNPGLGGDPNRAAAQDQINVNVSTEGWAERRTDTLTQSLVGGGGGEEAGESIIGYGPRSGVAGSGIGAGIGSGQAGGGPPAPFGPPGGGGGLGPKSPFMGISGNARKVIYIVDASGTMMSIFVHVRDELKRAVDVLKPIQAFNVIFFKDTETLPLNKGSMVMGTPDNKRKAYTFADQMAAAGGTDPIPAIRMAFAQKPDLIYILTDGFDNVDDFSAVVGEFRKLNPDKSTKVNTILIRSTENPELEKVLRTIASENGGIMKVVDKSDF